MHPQQLYTKRGRKYEPLTQYDNWTGFMVTCAVRYCLGRASYAPSVAMDWCKAHWHMLSAKDHHNIVRDVVGWLADLRLYDDTPTSDLPAADYRQAWADFAHWCCARNGTEFAARAVGAALYAPEICDAPEVQSFLKYR